MKQIFELEFTGGSSRVRSSSYEPPFSPGFCRDRRQIARNSPYKRSNWKLANGPGVGRDWNSKDRSNFALQTLDKLASKQSRCNN